jgi:uncharacterized SAM-binding protein YcdF (DUF218 family)
MVIVVLGTGAWIKRDWLLLSAADLWIVSDPIGPADAAAVFGGGLADRPFAAAQYYQQGLVKKILVANTGQNQGERPGAITSDVAVTEAILLRAGVPASAIETFGKALGNTYQEVFALRAWAERNNSCSIIVPTGLFSARRVRWMLHRAFPSHCEIRVIALDPPQSREDGWRHYMQGVTTFKTEVIKYLYYILRY